MTPASRQDTPHADTAPAHPGAPGWLKGLVYGMGVLLVLGAVGLGVGLYWKVTQADRTADAGAAPAGAPLAAAGPDSEARAMAAALIRGNGDPLPIPPDTRILETALDGTVLLLRLETVEAGRPRAARPELIWLYDLSTDRVLGTYTLPVGDDDERT